MTLVYAVASVVQWQTMEKSLRISQKAYVVVSNVQADFAHARVTIALENIGHVVAENVRVTVYVTRMDSNKQILEEDSADYSTIVERIDPSAFKPQIFYQLKHFTDEDASLLREGKEEMNLMCNISYEDDFGTTDGSINYYVYSPPPNEGWAVMYLSRDYDVKEEKEYRKAHPEEK